MELPEDRRRNILVVGGTLRCLVSGAGRGAILNNKHSGDPVIETSRRASLIAVGAAICCALSLAGCQGYGSSPPGQTTVSVVYGMKEVVLSWESVKGADYYRVLENPDGVSGYAQVGGDLTATEYSVTVPVHLMDWLNERYMVEACNGSGCSDSQALTSLDPVKATGYMKASNTGAGDRFGQALSLSADGLTLAVGAPLESSDAKGIDGDQFNDKAVSSGAVYIFAYTANLWRQQAYVKASNAQAGDWFGSAVSLSRDGDTLAVGAPLESSAATGIGGDQTDNSAALSGAVYVFSRSGSVWRQQAYIKASNTATGDGFGNALSLSADGDTLAVGASGESSNAAGIDGNQSDNSAANSGAAYVFTRSGTLWHQQAYVKASNPGALDAFGGALSLSGDGRTLAVGAQGESSAAVGIGANQADDGASGSGAVYVFTRDATAWNQQAYIKASNAEAGDGFGFSLGLSDDGGTLAVGAPLEAGNATGISGDQSDDSAPESGAVYLFARTAGAWRQQAYIKASNAEAGDGFGWSLALAGDAKTLAAAAVNEAGGATGVGGDQSDNSADLSGAVYVFTNAGSGWRQQSYVKAPNTQERDRFGYAVTMSADGATLGVGARDESGGATGIDGNQAYDSAATSGAAYLY